MLSPLLLAAVFAFATPADPLRAELDRVAARIEQLKAERMKGKDVGSELDRLLVRSQELAAALEKQQHRAPRTADAGAGPGPDELRERADALRDEADRVALSLAGVDRSIAEVRRATEAQARLQPQPPSLEELDRFQPALPAATAELTKVRALMEQRARLAQRQADLRAQAERLDAEAAALDHE